MELQDNLKNNPLQVSLALIYTIEGNGEVVFFLQPREKNHRVWEFAGGKVEQGEDPRSALKRELREELGFNLNLDTMPIKKLKEFFYSYIDLKVCLHCYLIEVPAKSFAEYGSWWKLGEIEDTSFPLIEGSRQIIAELKEYFK